MKPSNVILIITGIFLLAAGVVIFVLYQTRQTLSDAQKAADKAKGVVGAVDDFGMNLKKTWDEVSELIT